MTVTSNYYNPQIIKLIRQEVNFEFPVGESCGGRPNSCKTEVWGPTGFNMNPKGQTEYGE